jgi:hypothetical protein
MHSHRKADKRQADVRTSLVVIPKTIDILVLIRLRYPIMNKNDSMRKKGYFSMVTS